ncbi:hypothetical protein Gpo141_00004931 [Globisporangium polare]
MNGLRKASPHARPLTRDDLYGDHTQHQQQYHHRQQRQDPLSFSDGIVPLVGDLDSPATVAGDTDDLDKRHEYSFYDLQDDGALRGGGKVTLFGCKTFGLLLNYAGIGLMYGALPSTMLPFLKYYLNMESYQVQAASAVVNIAWSFKTFGGIVSDSFPIFGYRRKSYMVLGWALCFGALLFLSTVSPPEPYYEPGTRTTTRTKLNADAPHHGWMYVLTMALATFGYFFANVAADGMVVELAQREPMKSRGETQTLAYAMRSLFMIIADLFIGMSMNSERYGGDFSWSMDFNKVMLVLAFFALAPLLGSVLLLHEEKLSHVGLTFRARCREMWRIAQSRAVWQVLAFELVAAFCLSFSSAAGVSVETNWAKVQPFQSALASLVTGLIYTCALYVTKLYLLQVSWVRMYCVSTLWIVGVNLVYVGCTVFDIMRDQHFWLYMQAFVSPASALRFLLFSFPIVEIAEKGFEGTTYGLVVTFHNMAIPLGVSAYKSIDSYFDISDDRIHADSPEVRRTVFYTYLLAWGVQIASMGAIFLLPRQRLEIQHLRFYGGQSRTAGVVVVVTLAFVLIYSATTNVLSLFKSTQCLRIAGGRGC